MSIEAELKQNTHEYGSNAVFIAEMYERYLKSPDSISEEWQEYFKNFSDDAGQVKTDFKGGKWGKPRSQILGYVSQSDVSDSINKAANKAGTKGISTEVLDSIHAHMLIRAYRVRGHLIADLDPLGLAQKRSHPELDPAQYGFAEDDYDRPISLDGWLGHDKLTLREIIDILHETYCSKFAIEYSHIASLKKKEWLEKRIENSHGKASLTAEQKKHIFSLLAETVGFEEFLHKKFPGTKRFSAEGGEGLMVACHYAVERAADLGLKEVVVGMPHRGRLNVLTCFMGKPYVAMLSEFQGNLATPDDVNSSGDVKYHLGFSSDKVFGGNEVHMSLTSNPSHLETVNPVVVGKVRAKQDQHEDENREKVMGLLLHGDAAFCGQGVVPETLSLSDLDGYKTGGTIHVIVNNQVGFTTTPDEGHKSPYPTEVAKMLQSPIFHVNGDDPEAVAYAAILAAEFRAEFKEDVVIDMWCYRKHGHNEGDEPRWTQPEMYRVIDSKDTPREIYADRLVKNSVLSEGEIEKINKDFYNRLDEALSKSNDYKPEKADMLEGKWSGIKAADANNKPKIETGVDKKILKEIAKTISTAPKDYNIHKGVQRVLDMRAKTTSEGKGLDWSTAEALAFGSILLEGKKVRLSGQDCIRGTFSQRHSGIWNQDNGDLYFPLNNIKESQDKKIEVLNSNLSEYAVLGYEYGYSSAEPNALVLWEGQFGDFVNGAQIVIDQYVTSAEIKWLRMSGLVMLLPHGYEGQGPEHSSGRVERFLQSCAEDNIIVANCTTPANYFHILRRQVCRDYRKPLILMTPKSLLRHKLATSELKDMEKGSTFKRVLPEIDKLKANDKIKKLIICSGKVYYDLLEERRANKIDDVAIVRLEQIYPFPESSLLAEIKKYKNAEVVWVQEEPQNMGAWTFIDRRIENVLVKAKSKSKRPSYIGRPEAAATACGYMKVHKHQQEKLIKDALS